MDFQKSVGTMLSKVLVGGVLISSPANTIGTGHSHIRLTWQGGRSVLESDEWPQVLCTYIYTFTEGPAKYMLLSPWSRHAD